MPLEGRRILLGVTGGIAAYKSADLCRRLLDAGAQVQAVLTASAARFVAPLTFQALTGAEVPVELFDADRESRISHIQLARDAEVIVVAPATANFVAKMAHGLADDLLSTLLLAARCPVVVVPAMNTAMWEHPATQANLQTLTGWARHRVVRPDAGALACGEVGAGRMPDPPVLIEEIRAALTPQTLAGRTLLVTAGPTQEPLDAVRFLTNRSTGRMGFSVARAARARGADVTLVHGPVALDPPAGVELIAVRTAAQMADAVLGRAGQVDAVIKVAAVADARPTTPATGKIRKADLAGALAGAQSLSPTTDILRALALGRSGSRPILVGFAAEATDLDQAGPAKLADKGCDLLVANRIDGEDAGFGTDTNRAVIFDRSGGREEVALTTKDALADRLCERVAALLDEA